MKSRRKLVNYLKSHENHVKHECYFGFRSNPYQDVRQQTIYFSVTVVKKYESLMMKIVNNKPIWTVRINILSAYLTEQLKCVLSHPES